MPWYQYTGHDESGKPVSGHIGANDGEHAMDLLEGRRYDITSLIETEPPEKSASPPQPPGASANYLDGWVMIVIGLVLSVIGGGLSMAEAGWLGVPVGFVGGILLLAGVIRWAVEPVISQQKRVIELLEKRDSSGGSSDSHPS